MIALLPHMLNWQVGWTLVLLAFVSGALIGVRFHDEQFAGGYGSFRRRLMRLGHIALAALGMLNLLFALGPVQSPAASWLLIVGGITMPAICFAAAWRRSVRHFFFIPVVSLFLAVVVILLKGASL